MIEWTAIFYKIILIKKNRIYYSHQVILFTLRFTAGGVFSV